MKKQPEKIFIKPAKDGAVVRIPERGNRQLKAEGEFVVPSNYWIRRLSHGDVKEATPPAPAKKNPGGGAGGSNNT